ncbi:MAG TPA: sulfatase-like hydrolase/transferase [Myxococcota bacterium]|nr:sulfatase-like hydrolase/transferase [Myxococcota bacterium]
MPERWFRSASGCAICALALFVASCAGSRAPQPAADGGARGPSVILITIDGLRSEELFRGVDERVLASPENSGIEYEDEAVRVREAFGGSTPQRSRSALMPFFWDTLVPSGVLLGNPDLGEPVLVKNDQWFSAPGYIEILTGEPHADVVSNDAIRYPYPSFMEIAKRALDLGYTDVATIGSWTGFATLSSSEPDLFFTNTGFEEVAPAYATERMLWLGEIQHDIMSLWPEGRSDAVTYGIAAEYIQKYKPRVLYIAFGETDDWAHERRYDRYLDYIHVFDDYLRRLWTLVQSIDEYRDATTIIITTDHGRGHDPKEWVEHAVGLDGSEEIWIAIAGRGVPRRGEVVPAAPVTQSDVAATALELLGIDYRKFNPRMGPPIPAAFGAPAQP